MVAVLAVAMSACDPVDEASAPDNPVSSSASGAQSGDDGSAGDRTESGDVAVNLQAMTLTKTGGFTGENIVLDVTADGEWGLTGRSVAADGSFDDDTLARLAAYQTDPDLTVVSRDKPDHQCNDMYNYVLDIGDAQVRTDSCGQAPNQVFADLVALLSERTGI